MNVLTRDRRALILRMLCEASSLRSIQRTTGHSRNTISKLLLEAGEYSEGILDNLMKGLEVRAIEADEIWTFNRIKDRAILRKQKEGIFADADGGSWYLWLATDLDSRAVLRHHLARRDQEDADNFIAGLRARLNGKPNFQMSTDAYKAYVGAIIRRFGRDPIRYGQIQKQCIPEPAGRGRYSPPKINRVEREVMWGDMEERSICTSHSERLNLSIRNALKRFVRLGLGFSKSIRHLRAACSLWAAFYNLCWQHKTLGGRTPGMALGITSEPWDIGRLVPE